MATASHPVRKVRLFLASPGDVQEERGHLKRVVDELNTTVAPFKNAVVELVKWESHCTPSMGRPQGVINAQVGEYDIFLGIMWKRFGTPTGVADSGTEEEFRQAFACWQNDKSISILFYFCQAPFMPRTEAELQQCSKVIQFRQELQTCGLVWEYRDSTDFPDVVRPHLYRIILNLPGDGGEPAPRSPRPQLPAGPMRVYIASSSEGLAIAKHVQQELEQLGLQTAIWTDQFQAGEPFMGVLDSVLSKCDAAVMVLTADDQVMRRGATHPVARDNLIYELGLFHGRHGRNRTFVLSTAGIVLPSDLAGIVYLRYDPKHIEPAVYQLGRELQRIGIPSAG